MVSKSSLQPILEWLVNKATLLGFFYVMLNFKSEQVICYLFSKRMLWEFYNPYFVVKFRNSVVFKLRVLICKDKEN